MARRVLSASMTPAEFENGYWYALELKAFAKAIGIPSAGKLRKDEIEKAILILLKTGKIRNPARRNLSISGMKDTERGLRLDLPVVRFTNDKETKDFLEREAQKIAPGVKRKSGTRYRFNRWREERLATGGRLTYRHLVREYVRLNRTRQPFARIPYRCYVNFMSDFLASEKDATRERAMKAWKELKSLDVPKDYRSFKRFKES